MLTHTTMGSPLGELTLMNDDAFMRAARGLAMRAIESSAELDKRIEHAFRRCVVRRPSV